MLFALANFVAWNDAILLRDLLPLGVQLNLEDCRQAHRAVAHIEARSVAEIGDFPSPSFDDTAHMLVMRVLDVDPQMCAGGERHRIDDISALQLANRMRQVSRLLLPIR